MPHCGCGSIRVSDSRRISSATTLLLRVRTADTAPGRRLHGRSVPRCRGDFARQCGADPADLERLRAFARSAGLTETGADPGRRVLHLRANPPAPAEGVRRHAPGAYASAERSAPLVGFEQAPALPPEAIAVLGLDGQTVAHAQFRRPRATPAVTYTPPQLGALYGFPAGTDGTGQAVAVIELGGGFRTADLAQYFRGLGFPKAPSVTAIGVAGGKNQPGSDADGEVMLDIEVIGALAPAAAIAVYFTPNTGPGNYEAISQAAHDTARRPSVMSISWGGPRQLEQRRARGHEPAREDAVALGVSVTVACGDNGSSDGESDSAPHVDLPALSPSALACGGTRLIGSGTVIASEVVDRHGHGGRGDGRRSERAVPAARLADECRRAAGSGRTRRARRTRCGRQCGPADRLSGVHRRQVAGDRWHERRRAAVGWSHCAPEPELGGSLADAHAAFYGAGARAFRDITSGNNGAYRATPGWDACTGLGSPRGMELLAALAALKE